MPRIENGLNVATMLSGLDNAKAIKLDEINAKCEDALRALHAGYPDGERATFDQQIGEAKAFLDNDKASCPMLTALSKARGLSMGELARRVLAHAEAFSVAAGTIMGRRQGYADALHAATTEADVNAIDVDFAA